MEENDTTGTFSPCNAVRLFRLIVGVIFTGVLFLSSHVKDANDGRLPTWFYLILLAVYNLSMVSSCPLAPIIHRVQITKDFPVYFQVIRYLMVLSIFSFFCRVSDMRYGGMYMTLAMTMSNLGYSWPSTLALFGVDFLTVKTCVEDKVQVNALFR